MDPMAWAGHLGIDPKDLQLDHMTQAEQPQQLLSHCDSFDDGNPSLRYMSFGKPHSSVVGLAELNAGIQAQNFDMSGFTGPPIYGSHERANENFVSAHRIELCASGEPNAYQSTSYGGMQTSASTAWLSPAGKPSSDVDMNTFNQPSGSIPWQSFVQGSVIDIPSRINDLAAAKATPKKPKPVAKRLQNPSSRNRKNLMRLSYQRSSSPVHNKHAQAKGSQAPSNTSSQVDLTTHPKVDPQEAIALFEASIQPFSKFSQLKAADLINQLKQLVIEEQKYGRGSQSSTSDIVTTATAPSTLDSVSNAEVVDSECLTDNTSVSSTPRQPPKDGKDTDDSMSTGESQSDVKHEPCKHCGVKALFQCTSKNCGYSTHSFADYKRHESGEKHWPQERFMCLECVHHSSSAMKHSPSCTFCRTPFSALGTNIPPHYVQLRVQCRAARREITTFSRKDHLILHLRKDHNMPNMNITIDTWRFGIDSNWPRQCGFCGVTSLTWDERMNHLKEEFEQGNDMSNWQLPFRHTLDVRPSEPTLPENDDDDDQDDGFGGRGGYRAEFVPKSNCQPGGQTRNNATRANTQQKTSTQQRTSKIGSCAKLAVVNESRLDPTVGGKTNITLQRYLDDEEEPTAAPPSPDQLEKIKCSPEIKGEDDISPELLQNSDNHAVEGLDIVHNDGKIPKSFGQVREAKMKTWARPQPHKALPGSTNTFASMDVKPGSGIAASRPVQGLFRHIRSIKNKLFRKPDKDFSSTFGYGGDAEAGRPTSSRQPGSALERETAENVGKDPNDHSFVAHILTTFFHKPTKFINSANDHTGAVVQPTKEHPLRWLESEPRAYKVLASKKCATELENGISQNREPSTSGSRSSEIRKLAFQKSSPPDVEASLLSRHAPLSHKDVDRSLSTNSPTLPRPVGRATKPSECAEKEEENRREMREIRKQQREELEQEAEELRREMREIRKQQREEMEHEAAVAREKDRLRIQQAKNAFALKQALDMNRLPTGEDEPQHNRGMKLLEEKKFLAPRGTVFCVH